MAAMAASVASEFNDELTLLLNELSISLGLVGREHPARARLIAAQRAALRCTGITGTLLDFTRRNGVARPFPLKRLLTLI
jgi:C4-dicarboxylate-specific signal transduction histidine kinase